ncbi:hypothetical protein [Gemmata obscuriglobus]|uniref:hypothetical protein n=1 Tax=Gemmata obscuriglobus TaxID=114 RepID=UPI0012FB0500|nr:hypothetical protein [Gemmata obscuriglobus]
MDRGLHSAHHVGYPIDARGEQAFALVPAPGDAHEQVFQVRRVERVLERVRAATAIGR